MSTRLRHGQAQDILGIAGGGVRRVLPDLPDTGVGRLSCLTGSGSCVFAVAVFDLGQPARWSTAGYALGSRDSARRGRLGLSHVFFHYRGL